MRDGFNMNTQDELAHIDYLLTIEAMRWWYARLSTPDFYPLIRSNLTVREYYLKEHGLPIDSVIKGL